MRSRIEKLGHLSARPAYQHCWSARQRCGGHGSSYRVQLSVVNEIEISHPVSVAPAIFGIVDRLCPNASQRS